MIARSFRWCAQRVFQTSAIELLLVNEENGRKSYGLPVDIVLKTDEANYNMVEPTLRMPEGSAQSLLQALWDARLRPHSGEGVSAHVDALKHSIYFAEGIVNKLMAAPPATAMTTLQSSPDTFEDLRRCILKADERVRVLEGQIRMLGVNPI